MSQPFPPPPPTCTGFLYTVQAGDTMFLIARRFGVSLDALIAANPQIPNPSLIFPGQQICVPSPAPAPPTFLQHLQQAVGRTILVQLVDGNEFTGTLQVVGADHIDVAVDHQLRHVRIEAIAWFAQVSTT